MSSISIIGVGNMARAFGTLALDGGNTVELVGRDPDKAAALAEELGRGASTSPIGRRPTGDIVILAVPYASVVPVVTQYGEQLADKVIVDISNPFAPGARGLLTSDGRSAADEVAAAAPTSSHVVKAFNTIFGHVLADLSKYGVRLDVFLAGDGERAKKEVSVFVESLSLRPLDAGPQAMAAVLEQASLLLMGVAGQSTGRQTFALGMTILD